MGTQEAVIEEANRKTTSKSRNAVESTSTDKDVYFNILRKVNSEEVIDKEDIKVFETPTEKCLLALRLDLEQFFPFNSDQQKTKIVFI